MPTPVAGEVLNKLKALISAPSLSSARALENALEKAGYVRMVFGRVNQRSSVEANSESDRGISERLANAFDATLTAARLAVGISKSDPSLTPRNVVQRFICTNRDKCEWAPTDDSINFREPVIEIFEESATEKHRYRKHHPDDGMVTVVVQDYGTGISRERMSKTILDLNSEDKLKTFEAIGQFGHGGASSLSFCESALVITQPRFGQQSDQCYWTLIYPEPESEASKQELLRKWFADDDKLPLVLSLSDFPEVRSFLPGTGVWHFGYHRGGWIKRIAGPEQTNPWGRLSRLFFSYPLPFDIKGKFARTDTESGTRTLKGSFFRLMEKKDDQEEIELPPSEKSDSLIVNGVRYGSFSVFPFVLKDRSRVRDYVDPRHPIILTLNGQNHGELTPSILAQAKYPELSASTIVEIRLDNLEQEALGNIISNSREMPKGTEFTRELTRRVIDLLENDEALRAIETKRQEEKAKKSNAELNKNIQSFLSSILSDAVSTPGVSGGGGGLGRTGGGGKPRPEIPAADPPLILEFLSEKALHVPEGSTYLAKFKSDARPPKYSFHGDNKRIFAQLQVAGPWASRLIIAGTSDINAKGYGGVSLSCIPDQKSPIQEAVEVGVLIVRLQTTDQGRILEARLPVGVAQKPLQKERTREREIKPTITFHAPAGDPTGELAALIAETAVCDFGAQLSSFKDALGLVSGEECAYMGAKGEEEGVSTLLVEINIGNPSLKSLFQTSKNVEERIAAKERYCKDVVLDCYQHHFKIDDFPEEVLSPIAQSDESVRAAEIYLNHDKAIRFAIHERDKDRTK